MGKDGPELSIIHHVINELSWLVCGVSWLALKLIRSPTISYDLHTRPHEHAAYVLHLVPPLHANVSQWTCRATQVRSTSSTHITPLIHLKKPFLQLQSSFKTAPSSLASLHNDDPQCLSPSRRPLSCRLQSYTHVGYPLESQR
jgi:hypothetical protein